jgi:hypothetical protein
MLVRYLQGMKEEDDSRAPGGGASKEEKNAHWTAREVASWYSRSWNQCAFFRLLAIHTAKAQFPQQLTDALLTNCA